MRLQAIFLAGALAAASLAAAAVAEAPPAPRGNFGGGALVSPPRAILGPGNAIVALRALPERELEIEATVRGRCAGGDIFTDTKIAADGSFAAKGTAEKDPSPVETIKTTYALSGRFSTASAADGTVSATIERSVEGRVTTCRSGKVAFAVRRPTTGLGTPGAPKAARYYGTTSQRGAGPNRPIILRISADGRRITRALFGEAIRCSDGRLASGIEAPETNVAIDSRGRAKDRERDTITQGELVTSYDDRFTAEVGSRGARGTFSLSDHTSDRASGTTIQSCKTGTIHWRAAR